MPTWIYLLDTFKPVDVDVNEVLRLARGNPLELFNRYIREAIEGELGCITNVKHYNTYYNPREPELLVEYLVICDLGEVSVKLIYSENPRSALTHYYRYERRRG